MKRENTAIDLEQKEADSTWVLSRRLIKEHIKGHKNRIIVAIICMIIVAATTAANAWMMQPVLDKIFLDKNESMLLIIPLAVFTLAIIKGGASYWQSLTMKYIGQRIVTDMQIRLYEHLLQLDASYFDKNSSGKILSRFSNDIHVIRRSISNVITNVIKESFTLVFLLGLMFYQSVTLSLIAFIAFPAAVFPMLKLGRKMRRVAKRTQQELGEYTANLDDTFQGIKIVKAYCREKFEAVKARIFVENIFKLYVKAARIESISSPIMELLAGVAIAAVIWYGGSKVLSGEYTAGQFFSFMTALIMAYKPMKAMSGLNTNIQEGLASVRRYFSIIDMLPEIADKENSKDLKINKGEIIFENVSFSYDSEKGKVLKNISLKIPAGKRVALVGESGGGKSTIMSLIPRFYEAEYGSITIDGNNIKDIKLSSLRAGIALVNQEIILFDDTVKANIAYGKENASEEEITAAAYSASAHDFIIELPDGYNTLVGQRGLRLSGGQRQRLSIARAMLKNAPILLLDEATSALDPVSEHQVQLALDRLMKGRTTLVIAHRLSTIVNADIIYVVSKGEIVESGTHKELLEKNGEYTELFNKQFSKINKENAN